MLSIPLKAGSAVIARCNYAVSLLGVRITILVTASCMVFGSCGVLEHITAATYNHNVAKGPFDAIIIPGNAFDSVNTNRIFRARMFWAKTLYEQGLARNIIFSGAAVHTPYTEAIAMKIIADSFGIPANRTFVETRAEHTTQNVDYGLLLADSLGFKNIAIATDPIQALYLQHYLRQKGLKISVLPFALQDIVTYNKPLPPVNCSYAYVQNFVPLKERQEQAAQAVNDF